MRINLRYVGLSVVTSAVLLAGCASTPRGNERKLLVERTAYLQDYQLKQSILLKDICDAPSMAWPFVYYYSKDDWYSALSPDNPRGFYILASSTSNADLSQHSVIKSIDDQAVRRMNPQNFYKLLNDKLLTTQPITITTLVNEKDKKVVVNPVKRCISDMGIFIEGWINNKVVIAGVSSKEYSVNSISAGYLRRFKDDREAKLGILYSLLYVDTLNAQVKSGHDPRAKYTQNRALGVSAAYGATMALLGPIGAVGMIFGAPAIVGLTEMGLEDKIEEKMSETHQITDIKFVKAAKSQGYSIKEIIDFWEKYKSSELQSKGQAIKFGGYHPVTQSRLDNMSKLYKAIP